MKSHYSLEMLSSHAYTQDTVTEILSFAESDLSFNRHKASIFLCKIKVKMINAKAWYSHTINCVRVDPLHISDNGFVAI